MIITRNIIVTYIRKIITILFLERPNKKKISDAFEERDKKTEISWNYSLEFFSFSFFFLKVVLTTTHQIMKEKRRKAKDSKRTHWFSNKAPTIPVCGHPLFISKHTV